MGRTASIWAGVRAAIVHALNWRAVTGTLLSGIAVDWLLRRYVGGTGFSDLARQYYQAALSIYESGLFHLVLLLLACYLFWSGGQKAVTAAKAEADRYINIVQANNEMITSLILAVRVARSLPYVEQKVYRLNKRLDEAVQIACDLDDNKTYEARLGSVFEKLDDKEDVVVPAGITFSFPKQTEMSSDVVQVAAKQLGIFFRDDADRRKFTRMFLALEDKHAKVGHLLMGMKVAITKYQEVALSAPNVNIANADSPSMKQQMQAHERKRKLRENGKAPKAEGLI